MNRQYRFFLKVMIILISLGPLTACGVTSNSSSTGNGAGNASSVAIQSMSPGELARIQNQKAVALTPQNYEQEIQKLNESSALETLYEGLANPSPAIRERSREILTDILTDHEEYIEELKRIQKDNKKPESWYAVSLIIKEAGEKKTRAREAELKQWMGEE